MKTKEPIHNLVDHYININPELEQMICEIHAKLCPQIPDGYIQCIYNPEEYMLVARGRNDQ